MPRLAGFHAIALAVGDAADKQEADPMSMSSAAKDRVRPRSLPPFRAAAGVNQ